MATGTPIQNFNDFMQTTGPSYLTSANEVVNEAAKHNYVFNGLLAGKGAERSIQGGNEIRDVIMFETGSTYDHYKPNETFTWSMPQVTDTVTAHWRFIIDHMSWTDAEIELNMSEGNTRDSIKGQYKKLKQIKEQRLWTSMLNGMETDLFRSTAGNRSEMEVHSGKLPNSIFSFITERVTDGSSAGITVDGDPRGTLPNTWADGSVQGVDPTADVIGTSSTKWTNQISCYASPSNAGPDLTTAALLNADPVDIAAAHSSIEGGSTTFKVHGLFGAFDEMFYKVQYRAPNKYSEYFEDSAFGQQMILCSREGINNYKKALRVSNDRLLGAGTEDAGYQAPSYSGIPLTYVSQLDTADVCPARSGEAVDANTSDRSGATVSSTAGAAETAAGTNGPLDFGPRYYFINGEYLNMFFHSRRYMVKHDVLRHPNQPFTYVQPVDCWMNLFCRSRSRLGVIKPLVNS